MKDDVFDRIKEFTIRQTGVKGSMVIRDAELENDLGITGDDAVEYIVAFGKSFNVDISQFMAADYFSPEGDAILPGLVRMATGKEHPKQKELKIYHLEKAVVAGRLNEDVINS